MDENLIYILVIIGYFSNAGGVIKLKNVKNAPALCGEIVTH
jgi:hypothetical protein